MKVKVKIVLGKDVSYWAEPGNGTVELEEEAYVYSSDCKSDWTHMVERTGQIGYAYLVYVW